MRCNISEHEAPVAARTALCHGACAVLRRQNPKQIQICAVRCKCRGVQRRGKAGIPHTSCAIKACFIPSSCCTCSNSTIRRRILYLQQWNSARCNVVVRDERSSGSDLKYVPLLVGGQGLSLMRPTCTGVHLATDMSVCSGCDFTTGDGGGGERLLLHGARLGMPQLGRAARVAKPAFKIRLVGCSMRPT